MKRLDALRDLVMKNIDRAHQKKAGYYNKGRQDVRYQVGMVMRKAHVLSNGLQGISAKLALDCEGPYEIVEVKPPNVYMFNMGNGRENPKVHVSELKKAQGNRRSGKQSAGARPSAAETPRQMLINQPAPYSMPITNSIWNRMTFDERNYSIEYLKISLEGTITIKVNTNTCQ